MNEETRKHLRRFLKNVFECVYAEEQGDNENILKYVDSKEIKELCSELGFLELLNELENFENF